jgi:diguanylate cyclase (GGDEF)-like protein
VKAGLFLADQLLSSLLFVSYLLLILVWSFAGPITAAILTAMSVVIVFYLALATKEPWLLLQAMLLGILYLAIATFLYEIQKKVNNKRLLKEKLQEDMHLAQEDFTKYVELEKALNRRIDRFLDLHQFAETLKGIPTVTEVARRVVDEAHSLVSHADECALFFVDENNQRLELLSSNRSISAESPDLHGSSFDQWVMKRARPLIIEDSLNDFRFSTLRREPTEKLRSVCACPLMTENKVLGVLRVSSRAPQVFSSDDLHALDIISGLGAVTLRNRLLYDRMGELAIRDTLTGLYLNRYFQERFHEEFTRVGLKSSKFSVILLDIDHFKNYNDEFGHSAGDHVLKNIAKVILRLLSPADFGARYGGEEFALLLPNKDKKEAMKMAEHIRGQVQETKLVIRRMERSVTVSLGVATYPEDGHNAEELIRSADKHLYKAKNEGRNRVCGSI